MKTLETCWAHEEYACEFAKGCQNDNRQDMLRRISGKQDGSVLCAKDYFEQMPADKIANYRRDSHKEGYVAMGIEAVLEMLNSDNFDEAILLSGGEHETTSFKKFRQRYGKIVPFPAISDVKPSHDYLNLRCSELGTEVKLQSDKWKCNALVRVLSKVRRDFKEAYRDDPFFADAGEIRHLLSHGQPKDVAGLDYAHVHTLRKIGIEPIPRTKYCEVPVEYVHEGIVVRGSPDVICIAGPILFVIDEKRAMMTPGQPPKKSHEAQLTGYGLAVHQMLGMEIAGIVNIKEGRAFPSYDIKPEVEGRQRLPALNITLVTPDSNTIREVHEKGIVESFPRQQEVLANPDKWVAEKQGLEARGICGRCLDKKVCDAFTERLVKGQELPLMPEARLISSKSI